MKYLILPLSILLSSCALFGTKDNGVDTIPATITVHCNVDMPDKPVMALTENTTKEEDVFTKGKKALAELKARQAYEAKLEAAAKSCSK